MIRKSQISFYISVLAVVLFACGDDSTIEEQGVERLLRELWQVMPIRH